MLGIFSYLSAAVAFFVLASLLVIHWRRHRRDMYLLFAVVTIVVWSAVSSFYAAQVTGHFPGYMLFLELLKSVLLILVTVRLLSGNDRRLVGDKTKNYFYLLISILIVDLVMLFVWQFMAVLLIPFHFIMLGFVVLAVLGLVLLEQLYCNTRIERRWAIKYFCIGIGGLFVYDFYLFADALLYNSIDEDIWSVRGIVYAVLMPLIAIGVSRTPQWSFELFVSQRMVFHSATLVVAGVYLLAMAAGAYYIRYYGGGWADALQVLFLFLALLMLVLVFFSGQLRSYLRVFVSKYFFNYKYDYRDEWLRFSHILASVPAGDAIEEGVLYALAGIVDSPAGILWLNDDNGSYKQFSQVGMKGVGPLQWDGSDALIRLLSESPGVVNLDEYRAVDGKYQGVMIPSWLLAIERAWLLVPLVEATGLFGVVLLAQPRAPRRFNWEDSDLLKTAASQAVVYLSQNRDSQALMEARQFEAFNQFSTFIIHDIKNMVAQLSLMLHNAEKHRHNPDFVDDMIATTKNSVHKMENLVTQLRTAKVSVDQAVNKQVDLVQLVKNVVIDKSVQQPAPQWRNDAGQGVVVNADSERLMTIVGHLLQNAIDATPSQGLIDVVVTKDSKQGRLRVTDTGCGMDDRFIRDHLFKPFYTTKGGAGMGIGAYESRDYIRKMGGSLSVVSRVGLGTTFTMTLPLLMAGAVNV